MAEEPVQPVRDEDYNFEATITKGHQRARRIVTKIWLPKRVGERPIVRLYPRKRWDIMLSGAQPLELRGQIVGFAPGDVITIRIPELWTPRASTRSHGRSRSETVVETDAVDLQIHERRPRGRRRSRRVKTSTTYWLTRCPMIPVGALLSESNTGEVQIKKSWEFEITLASGAHLKFEKIYRYENREDGRLRYSEIIARHESEVPASGFATVDRKVLEEIDDFLAVVSFASRFRTACVGLAASSTENAERFRYFRGHISVPEDKEWDPDEGVIDPTDFDEFIRASYTNFIATGPHPLIRHALHLVTPRVERTMESSFTTLYAALETIVLWYREQRGLVYVIEDENDWRTLSQDVRSYIKNHQLLQGNDPKKKERRGMMTAKVGELRRVPFRIAFDRFCDEYAVTLDDLWPVHALLPEISLTEIRNRIVHGGTFEPGQFTALIGAGHHMRWTVERALLGVLRWPVDRSKVRNEFLQHFTAMTEMAEDRESIKGEQVAAEVSAASEGVGSS